MKVTQSVTQYPLYHVTYAPVKFEVATSKGLGADAFTSTLCDLDLGVPQNVAQYPPHHMTDAKIEVATSNGLGDAFTRKYNI